MAQKIRYQIMLDNSTAQLLEDIMKEEPLLKNYSQAINLLCERYKNQKRIISKLTSIGDEMLNKLHQREYELRQKEKVVINDVVN